MKSTRRHVPAVVAIFLLVGCAQPADELVELRHFPLDELSEIIARQSVNIDRETSVDGNGSLQITAVEPIVIRLCALSDIDVEDATLVYRARVRTAEVRGRVYLEMLCHFPELGEFFSRDLLSPLSGTTDWSVEETPFFLQQGQNPDSVKLNLVVEGTGTAWIDDVHLLRGPPAGQ